MMESLIPQTVDTSLWAMLGGGLLGFVSPCILPMLPVYAMYLLGGNADAGEEKAPWMMVLRRCLGLASSFILLFMVMGAGAGLLGDALKNADRGVLNLVSGSLMIVFGLWMLGVFHWKGVGLSAAAGGKSPKMNGFWGAFAMGVVLALSWTPCLTPLLANALMLAATAQGASMWTGMLQLAVFALGLVLPMLAFMLLYQWLKGAMGWLRKNQGLLRRIGGGLMVAYGLYMVLSTLL